jgi:hypothetical protein
MALPPPFSGWWPANAVRVSEYAVWGVWSRAPKPLFIGLEGTGNPSRSGDVQGWLWKRNEKAGRAADAPMGTPSAARLGCAWARD